MCSNRVKTAVPKFVQFSWIRPYLLSHGYSIVGLSSVHSEGMAIQERCREKSPTITHILMRMHFRLALCLFRLTAMLPVCMAIFRTL